MQNVYNQSVFVELGTISCGDERAVWGLANQSIDELLSARPIFYVMFSSFEENIFSDLSYSESVLSMCQLVVHIFDTSGRLRE